MDDDSRTVTSLFSVLTAKDIQNPTVWQKMEAQVEEPTY